MSKKEEFEMTSDEAKKLEEALKKEEFRNLLVDYANEISDPENRKRYEEEITQLERERGYDVKFLNPTPGFVVKTTFREGGKKVFINIATNTEIQPATPGPLQILPDGQVGKTWSIPYSLVPPKDGVGANNQKYTIFDCIFNPDTYEKGMSDSKFKRLMVSTAIDGIEKQFQSILERNNLKFPKSKYKGIPNPTVIRKANENELDEIETGSNPDSIQKLICSEHPVAKTIPEFDPTLPEYTIKYRGYFDMQDYTVDPQETKGKPKEIVVSVTLPKLETLKNMKLDVKERELTLFHDSPRYHLEVPLSYNVDFKKAHAKFVQDIKQLIVVLPILHKIHPTLPPREIPATIPEGENAQEKEEEMVEITPNQENSTGGSKALTKREEESIELLLSKSASQADNNDSDDVMSDDNLETAAADNISNTDKILEDEIDTSPKETPSQAITSASMGLKQASEVPNFQYKQTFKHFYFSFTVSDIIPGTISALYRSNEVDLTFQDESLSYAISIRLPTECNINANTSVCKTSKNGILLKIEKLGSGSKLWDTFRIGCGEGKMVEKRFLTETNILKEMEEFGDPWSEERGCPPLAIKASRNEATLQVYLDMKHSEQSLVRKEEGGNGLDSQKESPEEPHSENQTPDPIDNSPTEGREAEQATSQRDDGQLIAGLSNDLIYELND